MRVASLYPGGTELVASVGAADELVARSHWCDRPPGVRELPAVTRTQVEVPRHAPAREIDRAYGTDPTDEHGHGSDVPYRVDTERLGRVRPDLLVTQDVCEVCAVPASLAADALERLDPRPELVSLAPSRLEEVLDGLSRLGRVLGRRDEARRVRGELEARVERVLSAVPSRDGGSRVACLEWTDGLRSHGLWMPEFVEMLGAKDGLGTPGCHGRPLEWAEVRELDPEVIVVSPCGRRMPGIRRDMAALVDRPGWEQLAAVREGRVWLLDGEVSSRSGPRVVRALELLAAALYPGRFGWVQADDGELLRWSGAGGEEVGTGAVPESSGGGG